MAVRSPSPLPPFASVRPQLASLATAIPAPGTPFVYEIKYDGYRALTWVEEGRARMATRSGRDWTTTFREIAVAASGLPAKDAILDGEVAYVDDQGRTDFQGLQNALGSTAKAERSRLVYYAFDLLHLDGVDLRPEPLATRKELLRALLERAELPLRMSEDVADGAAFFREAQKHRLEGVVGKRTDRPYVSGRTPDWIKLKCLRRQELVIVGFTPQKESLVGLGALVLAVHEQGALRFAGKVGTGFTHATLDALLRRLRQIVRADNAPTMRLPAPIPHVTWVEPELVAEVRFSEWTSEGILRHPSFMGLREDLPAHEVVREVSAPEVTAPRSRRSPAELGRYLESVAPFILPFLERRPLVFRGVDGNALDLAAAGPIVFANAVELAAAHVPGAHVEASGSRLPRADVPDWMVFHLLPRRESGASFADLAAAAFDLRAALKTLALEAWVKTASGRGGEGLALVVPLARRYDWATIAAAAAAIAAIIVRSASDRFALAASTVENSAKITLDVGANEAGGTTALPYAPTPSGAIAMPIAWEALRRTDPRELTMRTVPRSLARMRRAPWADLLASEQVLPEALLAAIRHPP